MAAVNMPEDLPTTRVQSIPPPLPPLPPLVPPPGPAHKTQPLRALSRNGADVQLRARRRVEWRTILSHVKRVAAAVPATLPRFESDRWNQRRVGAVAGSLGLVMLVGGVVAGWLSLGAKLDDAHAGAAAAIALGRAAIAIATMAAGCALLRTGERLVFPSTIEKRGKTESGRDE
jgi:hypothetical protein